MIFMVLVIVPMFEQVYSRMGGELPAMTRWIISLSKAFPAYLAVTVFMALGGWFWWRTFGGRPGVQRMAGNLLLRMPLLGDTLRKNMQARFCKLLCLLASSGVPLLQGIDMLRGIITFHPYRTSFAEIVRELEQGSCLSDAMERFGRIYDRRLVVLLRVGEQTGRLPEMLRREGGCAHRRARTPPPLARRYARANPDLARRPARRRHPHFDVPAHVPARRNYGVIRALPYP